MRTKYTYVSGRRRESFQPCAPTALPSRDALWYYIKYAWVYACIFIISVLLSKRFWHLLSAHVVWIKYNVYILVYAVRALWVPESAKSAPFRRLCASVSHESRFLILMCMPYVLTGSPLAARHTTVKKSYFLTRYTTRRVAGRKPGLHAGPHWIFYRPRLYSVA